MSSDNKMLEKAINIAVKNHTGQYDKGGEPYILHCLRVMLKGKAKNEQIVGVLHDIIEDTSVNSAELLKEGFSKEIVNAILCLTKKQNEKYDEYLRRVEKNKLAVKVKLNDLEDNMNLSRLKEVAKKDIARLNKYIQTYSYLKANTDK